VYLGSLEAHSRLSAASTQLRDSANHLWVHQPRLYWLRLCTVTAAERSRQLPGGRPEHSAW